MNNTWCAHMHTRSKVGFHVSMYHIVFFIRLSTLPHVYYVPLYYFTIYLHCWIWCYFFVFVFFSFRLSIYTISSTGKNCESARLRAPRTRKPTRTIKEIPIICTDFSNFFLCDGMLSVAVATIPTRTSLACACLPLVQPTDSMHAVHSFIVCALFVQINDLIHIF